MSEQEKAEARAEGALANFLEMLENEMELKSRSPEYIETFWRNLKGAMCDFILRKEY